MYQVFDKYGGNRSIMTMQLKTVPRGSRFFGKENSRFFGKNEKGYSAIKGWV